METLLRLMAEEQGADPDALLEGYRNLWQPVPPIEDLVKLEQLAWNQLEATRPVLRDKDGVALMAWSWMVQAFRHTHAAFILQANGMHDTIPPQVRAAWEHGVYLSVLARVEDPDDFVEALGHRNIDAMDSYLREAGAVAGAEEAKFLELVMSAAKAVMDATDAVWARRVQQVCDRLVQGKEIYAYYRVLSDKCHVGFGSAEPGLYAAFSIGGLQQPQPAHEPHGDLISPTLLTWSLGATAWAAWSAEKLIGTPMFGDALKPIGDLGFFPLELKRREKRNG